MPSCEQSPNPHGACSFPGTLNCPHGLWEISQGSWAVHTHSLGPGRKPLRTHLLSVHLDQEQAGWNPEKQGKKMTGCWGFLWEGGAQLGWGSPSFEVGAQDLGRKTPYGGGGGEGFGENSEKFEGPTVQDWSGAGVCGPVGTANTPFLLLGSMGRSWSCIS